jgi:hypothetical protein
MTLVVAHRSMNRIVVMCDTMIANDNLLRPNSVPGRLKAIVLSESLTIAYAGLSNLALQDVRALKQVPGLTTAQAVAFLRNASDRSAGAVDFLVCSHEIPENGRLIKIAEGKAFEGPDIFWIGNADSAREVARMSLPPLPGESGGEYYSLEERQFVRRFHTYVEKNEDRAVGGMVINCLASQYGHCYQDHLGVFVERVTVPDPVEPELRLQMQRSGMDGYYSYGVHCAPVRGVAIVGAHFEQAGIGFVYDPLHEDEAEKVRVASQQEFQALILARSASKERSK